MSYDPEDIKDWRNKIRKCPSCSEVWIKVEGCEDVTTCGARPSNKYDVIESI